MRPDLFALASGLAAREERFALVTVVRREPPSSARVGDVAVVTEGGDYYGWVGGGCTRSTVLREARRAIADGEPRLLSLSPEPDGKQRPGMVALPMTCDSGGTVEIYVEPVLPVARLLLFGSSPAVRVLARIGHAMGYRVEVVDPDADNVSFPEAERVSQTIAADAVPRGAHVLVATMGERDLEAIEAVAGRTPAYLGVIASAKRFAQLRDALLARGISRETLEGISAPAGLDIGARTAESQVHRELASGLSMPVGIKNRTDGNVQVAIDAILTSRHRHLFPSLTKEGAPAILETTGNPYTHLVLRGGTETGPNFGREDVARARAQLRSAGLAESIMIDCSHGNSEKDPERQLAVIDDVLAQRLAGESALKAIMIESHLVGGRQSLDSDTLVYGQSITDACLGFDATRRALQELANGLC